MRNRVAYNEEIKDFLIDNSLLYTPKEMVEQIQINFAKIPSRSSIVAFYKRNNIDFKGKRNSKSYKIKGFQNFVEKNVQLFSLKEVCAMIKIKFNVNISSKALASYCKRKHFTIRDTKKPYPEEMKNLIANTYLKVDSQMLIDEIYKKFGRKITINQLHHYASVNHITKKTRKYSKEMYEFIKDHSFDYTTSEMIKKIKEKFDIDIEVHTLYNFYKKNNIGFKKVIHKAQIGDEEHTDKYEPRIKIGENKWQLKKRYLWEKYNNEKLKTNECIAFLDGNKDNFNKDNLVIVENGLYQIMNQNGMFVKTNKEVKELVKTIIEFKNQEIKTKKLTNQQKTNKILLRESEENEAS